MALGYHRVYWTVCVCVLASAPKWGSTAKLTNDFFFQISSDTLTVPSNPQSPQYPNTLCHHLPPVPPPPSPSQNCHCFQCHLQHNPGWLLCTIWRPLSIHCMVTGVEGLKVGFPKVEWQEYLVHVLTNFLGTDRVKATKHPQVANLVCNDVEGIIDLKSLQLAIGVPVEPINFRTLDIHPGEDIPCQWHPISYSTV